MINPLKVIEFIDSTERKEDVLEKEIQTIKLKKKTLSELIGKTICNTGWFIIWERVLGNGLIFHFLPL